MHRLHIAHAFRGVILKTRTPPAAFRRNALAEYRALHPCARDIRGNVAAAAAIAAAVVVTYLSVRVLVDISRREIVKRIRLFIF